MAWLHENTLRPESLLFERVEPMYALSDATACYVNGHFIAVVVMAVSFIEHTVVAALRKVGPSGSKPTLGRSLDEALEKAVFPLDLIARARDIAEYRNPISHWRDPTDPSTLETRTFTTLEAPRTIIERDAQEAIMVMNQFLNYDARQTNAARQDT
jgi:hypothetical protein